MSDLEVIKQGEYAAYRIPFNKIPEKKYSKAVYYGCWTCKKCGKFGGCDNKWWL